MKTQTMNIYTIDELSESVRSKIVKKKSVNIARCWSFEEIDYLFDEFVEQANFANIKVSKKDIHLSGFYSGNDYVSFSGEYCYTETDVPNHYEMYGKYKTISESIESIAADLIALYKEFYEMLSDENKESFTVFDDGQNSLTAYIIETRRKDAIENIELYINGMQIDNWNFREFPDMQNRFDSLVENLHESFENFAYELYLQTERQYEYDLSEENALEIIRLDERYFLEDGTEVTENFVSA